MQYFLSKSMKLKLSNPMIMQGQDFRSITEKHLVGGIPKRAPKLLLTLRLYFVHNLFEKYYKFQHKSET